MGKLIISQHAQGTPEWLAERIGCITGSRFKDARDYKAITVAQRKDGRTTGDPSTAMLNYASDLARERIGGARPVQFKNAYMKVGTMEEPLARSTYEALTGNLVQEIGFAYTPDKIFGVSVDGLVGDDGLVEFKTMVSSATLFCAVVDGDISEYVDQCIGEMWLTGRQWVDLCLWLPDLERLVIRRIERDEDLIQKLAADLWAFNALVERAKAALERALSVNHNHKHNRED